MAKPVYDSATKKVTMVEGEKTTRKGKASGEKTYFQVTGELREAILQFAKEDGIDVSSSKVTAGRAINTYVGAWIQQGLEERKKLAGTKAEGAATPLKAVAESSEPLTLPSRGGAETGPKPPVEAAKPERNSKGKFAKRA